MLWCSSLWGARDPCGVARKVPANQRREEGGRGRDIPAAPPPGVGFFAPRAVTQLPICCSPVFMFSCETIRAEKFVFTVLPSVPES